MLVDLAVAVGIISALCLAIAVVDAAFERWWNR